MKQFLYMTIFIILFIIMLLFPSETFRGASNGLLLWFQTILPTLLPFIILSNLLIYTNATYYISRVLRPLLQPIFRVSDESCYAILVGFLCGYPMGAKVISDLVKNECITKCEGQYLLSFCNNTSPMFLVSYVVMQNLKTPSLLLATLLILFLTPVFCSVIFRMFYRENSGYNPSYNTRKLRFDFMLFDNAIMNGFETITKVGGYIMIFSILFTLGNRLSFNWFLPVLEISNGIPWIANKGLPLCIAFPLILALTSFGGLCAVMQTYSMIQESGLRIFPYIIQKLITATVTSLFAYFYVLFIHQ